MRSIPPLASTIALVFGAVVLAVATRFVAATADSASLFVQSAQPTGVQAQAIPPSAGTIVVSTAQPPLAPPISPEVPGDSCRGAVEIVERVPPTIDAVAPASESVFLGTVTEVGPGQWNTPDGKPPADDNDDLAPFDVMRLLRVSVETGFKGEQVAATVTVWIRGGQIGCSMFTYSDFPDVIKVGQRFAFFSDDLGPRTGILGAQRVRLLWLVDDEGLVRTPEDGTLALDEFSARVEASLRSH